MTDKKNITDGELFADLQQSMTDIVLLEHLQESGHITAENKKRLSKEKEILHNIKKELRNRFSDQQLEVFLEKGYPRRVNLGRLYDSES